MAHLLDAHWFLKHPQNHPEHPTKELSSMEPDTQTVQLGFDLKTNYFGNF